MVISLFLGGGVDMCWEAAVVPETVVGNHCHDNYLHEGAFIGVVYFNMEKVLLYWSVDQYNNVH